MAIEPLNSAMTYHAQATQKVTDSTKAEVRNAEETVKAPDNYIDATTKVIEKGETRNDSGNSELQEQQLKNDKIINAVKQLNKNIGNSEAVFGIHEATNRVTIKIIDKETRELIKELPPEKTLDMIAKVWELAGILVDERR